MSKRDMISEPAQAAQHRSAASARNAEADGLRSPGLLAAQPAWGGLLFVVGVLLFAAFFYNLSYQGPLLAVDKSMASTLPNEAASSPPFMEYLMDAGFYLGKQVIVGIDILLGLYFLLKRFWRELSMLALGGGGSAALFHYLSTFINRPRPAHQVWMPVSLPGFPSGHAISVIVCYGLLAYLLVPKMRTALGKALVILAALFLMLFVGFSRVFTGGHYLTDILAGYAVGLAWAGLAYTLVELIFRRRQPKSANNQ
jgi:membrane-associated phospholipid phosphatase